MTAFLAGVRGLVLAFLVLLAPAAALAAPKFPPLTGRVVDAAQMLSPQAEQRLTDDFAALEQKTGRQVVVATIPDLQGYEIEDYGYQLGRAWGIGRAGKNDGVLLIVAPKERRVRLEVGYGLEPVLTDALSSLIINREILPTFKEGRMEAGVVAGGEAIVRQLGLSDDEAKAEVAAATAPQVTIARKGNGGGGIPVFVIIIIVFWLITAFLRVLGGRRQYGGGGGGLWWLLPLILSGGGRDRGGGGWSGGGGFGGGGGSFGGGGASGRW